MDRKPTLPAARIAIIVVGALVAGALIGAIALYVKDGGSGNAGGRLAAAESRKCEAKLAGAREIAAAATGDVAAMRAADRPVSLAGLKFDGPDGKPFDIQSLRGKVLLVNLWATWCAPCREEMPALDALQGEKGGADFEVIAINIDRGDDTKPKAFLAEIRIANLVYYRDASMGVFNDLKSEGLAFGLPVTLLADRDGCLLAAMNGPADWASDDAKRLIDMALEKG